MADLHLSEHVRFCEIGKPVAQRVFLDLRSDRYFSLPPAADAAFSAVRQNSAGDVPSEIAPLIAAGLLVRGPAGRLIEPTCHPAPTSSLLEQSPAPRKASLLLVTEILLLVVRARHAVRRKQLPRLLTAGSQLPTRDGRASCGARDSAVTAFVRARRMVPVTPNCLYDSLALRLFLQRRSIAVDLVIGTKLHPFAAHCWLQDGTIVLNDSLAAARGFVPILVA